MKRIVLIEIYIVYLSSVQVFGECPDEWTSFSGSCYAYVDFKETWTGAAEVCERFRGYLVEITSSYENDFVKRFVKNRNAGRIWTGGNDLLSSGSWRWLFSGERIKYFDWTASEPSMTSIERCIQLWDDRSFEWDDANCNDELAFVCERSPIFGGPGSTGIGPEFG